MCLAIPMVVREVKDGLSKVEYKGVKREVSTLLVDGINEGDYILIHAGFAISKIDKVEAAKTIALIDELTDGDAPL